MPNDPNVKKEYEFQGLHICVETPKGDYRHWHDPNSGESGSNKMLYDYGYIENTLNVDGDAVDVYVGPSTSSQRVFVVTQMKKPGFEVVDENKVMLGFNSPEEAKAAYLKHYNNPKFFGDMTELTMAEFKKKLDSSYGYLLKSKLNVLRKFGKLYGNMEKSMSPKSESAINLLKSVSSKLDETFLKGSMVAEVEKKDPKGTNEKHVENLEAQVNKGSSCAKAEEEEADDIEKSLKAINVMGMARRARLEAEAQSAGSFKQPAPYQVVRTGAEVVVESIFNMTPAHEPPPVPKVLISAPQAADRPMEVYKSCATCGCMNKSLEACKRCASFATGTAPEDWRR